MSAATLPVKSEEEIQASIIEMLTALKYDVLQTSRRGVFCRHCHRKTYGGDGASFGVPDLLVRNPAWPEGRMLGLEVKRPGGKWSSPEQVQLWKRGMFARVESIEDAAYAILTVFCGILSKSQYDILNSITGGKSRAGVFCEER